jgi:NADPH:quinone reductase-like Zn-dependent oxidoreductase
MKQVTQRLRNGVVEILDVPEPVLTPETVLVDVRASLLSAGTERAKVKAGKKSLIGKARSRPDQVAQVIDKARSDGVLETVRAVRARLDQPSVLGYSAAGVVLAVGTRVRGVAVGERVAIGGGDYAVHAEIDRVSANLCVPLPENVPFEEGCFACVGSIALHGVRQADVSLGERVAVMASGSSDSSRACCFAPPVVRSSASTSTRSCWTTHVRSAQPIFAFPAPRWEMCSRVRRRAATP